MMTFIIILFAAGFCLKVSYQDAKGTKFNIKLKV